jgi:hypothetical protein
MGVYSALVCINGHVLTKMAEESDDRDTRFCPQCGKAIINLCPKCASAIRGWTEGGFDTEMDVADYCPQCGEPYPWQLSKLESLAEAIDELEGLPPDEKEKLSKSIPDLIANTPKTELAAQRMKKAFAKADTAGRKAITNILSNVATEEVNRLLSGR